MDLKGRSFFGKLLDFTPEEIIYLVDLAQDLKEKRKKGIRGNSLKDKNIATHFRKAVHQNQVFIHYWSTGRGCSGNLPCRK